VDCFSRYPLLLLLTFPHKIMLGFTPKKVRPFTGIVMIGYLPM
jgi:hypothetical protein